MAYKIQQENNLPHITPHIFRHMIATYLITSSTALRTVACKLGHTPQTCQTVYSHPLKSAEKETTEKMGNFIEQAAEKAKQAQKKQAK